MGNYWSEIADQNQTQKQIQFLKNVLPRSGLVLDLACGTGRHLIPLSMEGYDMVGLDISFRLLKMGKNEQEASSWSELTCEIYPSSLKLSLLP